MSPTDNHNSQKSSILKDTRESKGLTLEIVHEATKIPMDALKAIEEGYSSRILSPFYYRGFIKIYAEFLGLDVAEMYKEYGIGQASKPATAPVTNTQRRSKPKIEPAGPNILLEQLQEGFAFIFKPKTLAVIGKVIGFVLVILALIKMSGCIASHWHKKSPTHHQTMSAQEERTQPIAEAPVASVHHQSVAAPSENNKVEVAVRAVKDTWIRVKTDDKVVFESTLSKGSMDNWSADTSIELAGRNIDQLDMEVNGKHVGMLGGGERRIKKVLITQEGLTVKK